jgi:hypothetical protein
MHLKVWASVLIGNLMASFVMSYFTMPHYSNRILRWWLKPRPNAPQPGTNLGGIAVVLAMNLSWAVLFCLLTTKIWHL